MILDAISEALAAGTTEQVHGVAVLQTRSDPGVAEVTEEAFRDA